MYDYRSTKKKVSRAPFGVGRSTHRSRSMTKSVKRPVRASKPRGSLVSFLSSLLVWLGGGILVALVVSYLAIKFVLPGLLPLTSIQTFLFVPTQGSDSNLNLVIFNPSDSSLNIVNLDRSVIPTLTGSLSLTEVNYKLGKMVDQVLILTPEEDVSDRSGLQQYLRKLHSQKTFGLPRDQKFKLWLFAQSLASSDVTIKEIKTSTSWQQFVASMARQLPFKSCSIALINSTEIAGLGKEMSQLLEQSGYQVIKVDSQSQALSESEIHVVGDKPVCLNYAERLTKSLVTQPVLQTETAQPELYRADIVIILGNDMAKILEE